MEKNNPVDFQQLADADRIRSTEIEDRKQRVLRRNGRKGARVWGYSTASGRRNRHRD
jgi:hypothetical protein